jgi:PAS domain S-box-containing protein
VSPLLEPRAQELALRCCREGVVVVDVDHSVSYVSPSWLAMHGFAADEPAPATLDDFHTKAQARDEVEPFLRALARGEAHARIGHLRRDRTTFETQMAGVPLETNGALKGYVLVAEPPATADELAQAGTFVHSILENIPDMIFVKDANDLRFALFNRAGEELLGYQREELLGKNDYDFFTRPEADFFTAKDREVLAGQRMVEVSEEPIHTRNKGVRWLHTKKIPVRDARTGAPRYLLGISEDITDRKLNDDALRVAIARQQVFVETSEALAASLDFSRSVSVAARALVPGVADGCALYVAPGGGLEPIASSNPPRPWLDDLVTDVGRNVRARRGSLASTDVPLLFTEVTRSVLERLTPDHSRIAAIESLGASSAMLVPLVARERKLGLLILWCAESGRRYREDDLDFAVRLARRAAHDIDNARIHTELARARTEAQQAVHARDEFLSIASHELRAPLAALLLQIQSLVRAVERNALAAPRLQDKLGASERQVKRMARLVDGLFDMSRIVAGKLTLEPEQTELGTVVTEVVGRFAEEARLHGCDLRMSVLARPVGSWDAMRLEQVVTNLLTNAVKYAPGKPVDVTVFEVDGRARLSVRDHGPGIAPECIGRVFERFTRAARGKPRGLGLGLYITRQIVLAHGGEIVARNHPEGGAELVVELPAATPSSSVTRADALSPRDIGSRGSA